MLTTADAPPWLRRSDQAVTWDRRMLSPHRAVVTDCETTDLPGALSGKVGYSKLQNRREPQASSLAKALKNRDSPGHLHDATASNASRLTHDSCSKRETC